MASITPESVQPWIANRIINFFNWAKSVSEITQTVKDDPVDGEGRGIGRTVAKRILQKRGSAGWRRFRSLDEIYSVDGMGPDKLEDLVYTFGLPAAQAFVNSMYDNSVIYRENWPLKFYSKHIPSTEEFVKMAQDEKLFRAFVETQMEEIFEQEQTEARFRKDIILGVRNAYIDPYNNSSSDHPAYEFAQWFYSIDMGNFFFYESGIPQTRQYFEYHPGSPWEMELRMFKGVQAILISGGIIPTDLATVVNYPEQVITIWSTALFD